ncbi:hypothetical protein K449DRAFT_440950 [Hypoxylon sp. EC38]|nr:hypothetical protein K449DRAFT_440950 [Hypoxylon sp. EC38]
MTSLYDLSIPVVTKALQTEVTILKKAEDYAKENNKPITDLINARLISDMLPLSVQVSISVATAKKTLQVLAGKEFTPEVKELSLEESYAGLADTLKALAEVKPEEINGKESNIIEFSIGKRVARTTAIDGKEGVPLGKMDYLTHLIEGFEFK